MLGKLGGRVQSTWCNPATLRKNFVYGSGAKDVLLTATTPFFYNFTVRGTLKRWVANTSSWVVARSFKTASSGNFSTKPTKVFQNGTWVTVTTVA